MWVKNSLQTWGRSCRANSEVSRPERQSELFHLLQDAMPEHGVIAYGNGRSYGDMALNEAGRVIMTQRLDRILDFNPETGVLIAEPGVTFDALLTYLLPQGWAPAVVPGTLLATLGGAIANDVHGKNHWHQGNFGRHVLWVEVLHPNGVLKLLSREQDPELFFATIGGLGLTGIINRVGLQLIPASINVQVRQRRCATWDEVVNQLMESAERSAYSAAWLDYPTESAIRGILHTGDLTTEAETHRPRRWSVPVPLPVSVLHSPTRSLINRLIWQRVPETGRDYVTPLAGFINPLDSVMNWNYLYGPKGCYQFQCVIPLPQASAVLRGLLQSVHEQKLPMNLGVLKVLGPAGEGILSFPKPGLTLAMDFSATPAVADAIRSMIDKVIAAEGRVYLAKDAVMTAEQFQTMYPQYRAFQDILKRNGLDRVFQSNLSRRLGITS